LFAVCVLFFSSSLFLFYFFFASRRRHTRLQGDWSSDVCSSDLPALADLSRLRRARRLRARARLYLAGFDLGKMVPGQAGHGHWRSEEHTSELQSPCTLVCRPLPEKKKRTCSFQTPN